MTSYPSAVRIVSVTPEAEKQIAYCARVSNPANQENENFKGLIKYCIRNKHWSVFEHGFMTVEINTSLAIATQILRHRTFTFQQFSQRYADSTDLLPEIPLPDLRRQDLKNRQNSVDDISPEVTEPLKKQIQEHFESTLVLYKSLLDAGVAKECARFVLPQATQTRIYMSGTIRSWIHYIELRSSNGTQKEHMLVAESIKGLFNEQFPSISEALGWSSSSA